MGYGGPVASSVTRRYGPGIKCYLAHLTAASPSGAGMRLQVDSYNVTVQSSGSPEGWERQ